MYVNVSHSKMKIRNVLNVIAYLDELFTKFKQQTTNKLKDQPFVNKPCLA